MRLRPALIVTVALSAPACRRTPPRVVARDATVISVADTGPPPRPRDPPPAPSPPRMFRLDPRHTGRSGYRLPRDARESARITTGQRISAQAVVALDGTIAWGSHDGVVYGATLDGDVRWRTNTGDRIYTTPFVGPDGTLYLGTDADRFVALGPHGRVRTALATEDDADTSPVQSPDGTVYFASGRTLWSTDRDLTVRWRLDLPMKVFSSPALAPDGSVVFGCQDDSVYAVTPAGAVRWSVRTGGDVDATPMIAPDGTIFVGSDDGNVYAISADGRLFWRQRVRGFVRAGAALGLDNTVVVATYGPNPRVVALDRVSGRELWSFALRDGPPTAEYGIASAPLVDREGNIAFGAPDDALYLLNEDGTLRQRITMPSDVDGAPVLVGEGVLAVGCDDGAMRVFTDADARDGG